MKINVLRDGIVTVCFLLLLLLIAIKVETDAASTFTGRYRVVDGDSLALGDVRLRLSGIDAPEFAQTCLRDGSAWRCGEAARQMLVSLVGSAEMTCKGSRKDKYQRLLVACRNGEINVNREMIRRGMAVSFGGYEDEEKAAREERDQYLPSTFERLFGID